MTIMYHGVARMRWGFSRFFLNIDRRVWGKKCEGIRVVTEVDGGRCAVFLRVFFFVVMVGWGMVGFFGDVIWVMVMFNYTHCEECTQWR